MDPFTVYEISTAPKEPLSSFLQDSACSLPVLSDTSLCTGSVTPRPTQAVSSDPGTHWNNCWVPPFLSACPAGRSQASCVWQPQPRTLGACWEYPPVLQAQLPQGVPPRAGCRACPSRLWPAVPAAVDACCPFWVTRGPGHCLGGRRRRRACPLPRCPPLRRLPRVWAPVHTPGGV